MKAINYAIDMKVDVINYSGGGMVSDFRERQAIERANSRGILFVAAAGNDAKILSSSILPGKLQPS